MSKWDDIWTEAPVGHENHSLNFGQQVLTKYWFWGLYRPKTRQKWPKRQQLPKKVGPFCYMGLCTMIFGWKVAQRVYLNLRKQSKSCLQSFWKYLCTGKHIVHFSHFRFCDFHNQKFSKTNKNACFWGSWAVKNSKKKKKNQFFHK